ncbi:zinc finger CCCH domain-containing protein 6-like [Osmerus eperlanus]|uniref:zinc finger CCCH domain-containing protein 6-like n=1 Tax=Osmerus eperlanus TaxID=29151 RepID=UPI002E138E43
MAFANLFTSIPNDVTSPREPASFEREDGELEPDDLDKDNEETNKTRNRSLLSSQQGASKMKKKRARQSFSSALPKGPSKKVRDNASNTYFSDLASRARDYHMKKNDYKQPGIDFSRELDNYNRVKLANQCSSQTEDPAQSNGVQQKDRSVQNEDNQQQQQQQKKKKKKKKNKKKKCDMEQQSQTNWRGNPTERGGHQAHQSRHFSSMRGRGFANKGGQWDDRGQDGSSKGSNSPWEQQDGSRNGGGRKEPMGRFQNTKRFQRNGRGFCGGRRQFEQENVVERKRVMTQEFKDQNVIEKDGRFICRHFLLGKCIKASC